jgi:hypothetical protein
MSIAMGNIAALTQGRGFMLVMTASGTFAGEDEMTPQEIAAKADQLKNEANAISIPLSTAGQLALFRQVKRMVNDVCVLIRELAEAK